MQIRTLGTTGLRVSLVGLGCNNFGARLDLAGTRAVVDAALDAGITFFDTADNYGNMGGSESLLGEILGERRQGIVLATKFASPMDPAKSYRDASRRYIMQAVDASLRRLRTDWIDLYQLHWPDPLTPMAETLRALDDLTRSGKVRYVGCCNLEGWQIADAIWTSRQHDLASFASVQDEWSVLVRNRADPVMGAVRHYGLGFLPYYPLASGLLTGKYVHKAAMPSGRLQSVKSWADRFLTDHNWEILERLRAFCEQRGHTLVELAFSWLAAQPAVSSIIAGASTPAQLQTNARSTEWNLTEDDLKEIDRLVLG